MRVGPDIEAEKDALLEAFFLFARAVCGVLAARGAWADYIDPCSGLAMVHKESSAVYNEASGTRAAPPPAAWVSPCQYCA